MSRLLGIIFIGIIFFSCSKKSTRNESLSTSKSLNGTWNFIASNEIDDSKITVQNFKTWDTIKVPGNWDTRDRYATYVGKAYYQRNFSIPPNWSKKQIRLKFGAVYQSAKVWLNGQYLGNHIGGYLPFEFNISEHIKNEGENSLIVMADNTIRRGAWWAWGGISREVSLYANKKIRMIHQHISAEPNFEKNKILFTIKYKVENNRNTQTKIAIQSKLANKEKLRTELIVPKNSITEKIITLEKNLADFELWNLETPKLYQLISKISIDETVLDQTTDNFGIRKFEVKGEQFFLNNKPVRLNGMNRVHDHPDFGNTEPDSLIEKDMKDIMSLGCRFSRLMHAPLSENILNFCDNNGFLLIEEIPVWGAVDPNSKPNNPLTKKWMKDLIERDYNHPSVIAWSVGNELRTDKPKWGKQHLTTVQYEYVNEMVDYVTTLDSTRLKTYVSNTAYQGGEIGKEPYEKLDFLSINSYGHALKIVEKVHERFPNKPIFLSEIGKGQIGPAPEATLDTDLLKWIKELREYPYITGISLWSYNDYRSDYKGTPESGFREWGIVDEKRNKKKAYQQVKEVYKYWQN